MKALFRAIRWRCILLVSSLTPPCRRIAAMASGSRERPLGWFARARLRAHLAICDACGRYLRQMEFLARLGPAFDDRLPSTGRNARLAAEARERLKRRLRCGPAGDATDGRR